MRGRFHDITDEELVKRIGRDDEAAFEELVLRHQDAVRRWIRWIDRRPDRVDDLAQESFIKAWKARHGFRGDSSFRTWVMKIAVRVCLDQKRRFEPRFEQSHDDSQLMPDGILLPEQPGMDRVLIEKARIAALRTVLDTLAPEARSIIVLRYVEDYNATEIGEMIGKPAGTVRRLLFEARHSLRDAMIELNEENDCSRGDI